MIWPHVAVRWEISPIHSVTASVYKMRLRADPYRSQITNSSRFTSEALINEFCRAAPSPETRASPGSAGTLLSTVMLLAIIVTTTCLLRTGVARDMRT